MNARLATAADNELLCSILNEGRVKRLRECDNAGEFNPSVYTETPPNFAVVVGEDDGCFLARCCEVGGYEIHTNLLPRVWGKSSPLAVDALMFAFLSTDAVVLYTKVPDSNHPAYSFALRMGFQPIFRREGVWLKDGKVWGMQYMRMGIDDWCLQGRLGCVGEAFHTELHRKAPWIAPHPHDPVHEAYVGLFIALCVQDRVEKGQFFYNRWARFAGYETIKVLSTSPLKLDIGSALIHFEEGELIAERSCHA